jgi:hypothetical protein
VIVMDRGRVTLAGRTADIADRVRDLHATYLGAVESTA